MNFIKVLLSTLWLYRGPDDLVVLHLQEEQLPQGFFGGGGAGVGFLISLIGFPLGLTSIQVAKARIINDNTVSNPRIIQIISLLQ